MTQKTMHGFVEKILGRTNFRGGALVCSNGGGRTVTEIIEQDPGQVNEVWCRKILRQLLRSLEDQYTMRLPHRAITPDTLVVNHFGEPTLLPSKSDSQPDVAKDLTALASVIHYAITRELGSTRPLQGRALAGYSNSIIKAIDRSMARDPNVCPQTIDELRAILGIVSSTEVQSFRTSGHGTLVSPPQPQQPHIRPLLWLSESTRPQRPWSQRALASGTAAVVLGTILTILGSLRGSGLRNDIQHIGARTDYMAHVHTDSGRRDARKPEVPDLRRHSLRDKSPASPSRASNISDLLITGTHEIARASGAASGGMQGASSEKKEPVEPTRNAPSDAKLLNTPQRKVASSESASTVRRPVSLAPNTVATGAILDLRIRPWGVVYVDGIDRGISPPIKRLTLPLGQHFIVVQNPNFGARTVEVDTTKGQTRVTVDFVEKQE